MARGQGGGEPGGSDWRPGLGGGSARGPQMRRPRGGWQGSASWDRQVDSTGRAQGIRDSAGGRRWPGQWTSLRPGLWGFRTGLECEGRAVWEGAHVKCAVSEKDSSSCPGHTKALDLWMSRHLRACHQGQLSDLNLGSGLALSRVFSEPGWWYPCVCRVARVFLCSKEWLGSLALAGGVGGHSSSHSRDPSAPVGPGSHSGLSPALVK